MLAAHAPNTMRVRTRNLTVGLASLFLAFVSGAVPALAQGSSVSTSGYPGVCTAESVPKTESDKAHDLFRSGKQYYDDNNQELAISLFRDAYKKDCSKHEILIIISRAYELKGDKAEAARALEIFLQRDPTNPEADTYRRRIKQLRDSAAPTPPPTAPTTAPTTAPSKGEDRGHTPYPWILVGVGGVGVAIGVVIIATTPDLPTGCNKQTSVCERLPPGTETEQAYKDRQSQAGNSQVQPRNGGIVAGIGGALVITGLLWHILEPTGPAETGKPRLRPDGGPGYAGLSFGGTF